MLARIAAGAYETADCSVSAGWACDPDGYTQPVAIHFYLDGPAGQGANIASVTANVSRADIAAQCGGNAAHGFSFPTPSALKDGKAHTLYAYALNLNVNNNPLLAGSPKNITCVTADVTPPAAAMTAPANGATVSGIVTIAANASDNVGVAKVEFHSNGTLIKTLTAAPYSFTMDTTQVANGAYTLQAKAYDAAGNAGSSSVINVTVSNVAPDSVPKGAYEAASCTVSTGWACDPDGYNQPVAVHFYLDGPAGQGTNIGSADASVSRADIAAQCGGSAAHGFSFPTPAALKDGKAHTLYAYALNINVNNNPLLAGSPKTITCTTADTTPPVAALTAPANGAALSGVITIAASVSDNVGVAKVEVHSNGTLIKTLSAVPYSFPLDTTQVANGIYTLQAKAYDGAGNAGTSPIITVSVSNASQPSGSCPAGWVCPAVPLHSATVGAWLTIWWQTPGAPIGGTHWTEWSRYQPVAGYYDSGAASVVQSQSAQMKAAGIDYVLLDHTNGIGNDGGEIEKNGQGVMAALGQLDASQRVSAAVAIGYALWGANSLTAQNSEAQWVVDNYAQRSGYFSWQGKPLLVNYNSFEIYRAQGRRDGGQRQPAAPAVLGRRILGLGAEIPAMGKPGNRGRYARLEYAAPGPGHHSHGPRGRGAVHAGVAARHRAEAT